MAVAKVLTVLKEKKKQLAQMTSTSESLLLIEKTDAAAAVDVVVLCPSLQPEDAETLLRFATAFKTPLSSVVVRLCEAVGAGNATDKRQATNRHGLH